MTKGRLGIVVVVLTCLTMLMPIPSTVFAGHGTNFKAGPNSAMCATLAPPGFYLINYTVAYHADKIKSDNGDMDGKVDVFSEIFRFVYSTKTEILGGRLLGNLIVPLQYMHAEVNLQPGYLGLGSPPMTLPSGADGPPGTRGDKDVFGLGDILLEPFVLGWNFKRADLAVGAGMWLPTGKYDSDHFANNGLGTYMPMLTWGSTIYFDEKKTWNLSFLNRYTFGLGSVKGEDFSSGLHCGVEWAFVKSGLYGADSTGPAVFWCAGLSGFNSWQLTRDRGSDADHALTKMNSIGPEVGVCLLKHGYDINFRFAWDYSNRNAPQGWLGVLRLVKSF